MLSWLGDKILMLRFPFVSVEMFTAFMIAMFVLLMVFFLRSPRMNARAEAPAPAPRRLARLALAIERIETSERSNVFLFFVKKMERPVVWLLRKADWLFHDKLNLLPDARTGRRLNFFALLFTAILTGFGPGLYSAGRTSTHLMHLRDEILPTVLASANLWNLYLSFWLFCATALLPFFLLRKNREFYLDVAALLSLVAIGFLKLLYCWPYCCFGAPSAWGIYNPELGTTVFPVQLLEFACYFFVSVLGFFYMLYAKSYRPGRGCTFITFFYMIVRFCVEPLRYHSETYRPAEGKMFFGLYIVQVMCLIGCVIAIVWLFLLPLEKKLMDRANLFIAGHLRKLAMKSPLFAAAMQEKEKRGRSA